MEGNEKQVMKRRTATRRAKLPEGEGYLLFVPDLGAKVQCDDGPTSHNMPSIDL